MNFDPSQKPPAGGGGSEWKTSEGRVGRRGRGEGGGQKVRGEGGGRIGAGEEPGKTADYCEGKVQLKQARPDDTEPQGGRDGGWRGGGRQRERERCAVEGLQARLGTRGPLETHPLA